MYSFKSQSLTSTVLISIAVQEFPGLFSLWLPMTSWFNMSPNLGCSIRQCLTSKARQMWPLARSWRVASTRVGLRAALRMLTCRQGHMLTQNVFLSKARCAIKGKSAIDVWAATQTLQSVRTGGWSNNKKNINQFPCITFLPSEFMCLCHGNREFLSQFDLFPTTTLPT